MLALYRSDRQADALQAYQDARRTLVEELGIEPGERLRELERAVLAQDPALQLGGGGGPAAAEPAVETPRSAFVGRERELAELVGGLDDAFAGRGRLFLLGGEPGIGKSRLGRGADRTRQRARGARILVGRCWEAGGAPAYWPWVQSLRAYVARDRCRGAARAARAGRRGSRPDRPRAARALPRAAGAAVAGVGRGALPPLRGGDARSCVSAAETGRSSFVLDDLHAADEPSLLLLRFVARELAASRLLVVGAYRDVDPDAPRAADARRWPSSSREPHTDPPRARRAERARRGGLHRAHDRRRARARARPRRSTPRRRAIRCSSRSSCACSTPRAASLSADAHLRIPPGVRAVIGRRVGRLSERCRTLLLVAASVMGREFGLDALARLSELDPRRACSTSSTRRWPSASSARCRARPAGCASATR